jgi:hypothetical protein
VSFLDDLLLGVKRIAYIVGANRTLLPPEPTLSFQGSGVTAVTDDPVNGQTIVTISGGGGGGPGSNYAIAEIQGNSTVQANPGLNYLVNATAGTPGPVSFQDMSVIVAAGVGAHFYVKREDATGITNDTRVYAPTGAQIEDPNAPGNYSSSYVHLNVLSQSAEFFLRDNGNLELH